MAPPDSGEAALPSRARLWRVARRNEKKQEDLFYQSFTQSLLRNYSNHHHPFSEGLSYSSPTALCAHRQPCQQGFRLLSCSCSPGE